MIRLFVRIDFEDGESVGPGKIRLLELVDELGSIRSAATAMAMSYAHAWKLLHAVQETFHAPVVTATKGGRHGGLSKLTELGRRIVKRYRDIEGHARSAAAVSLDDLN